MRILSADRSVIGGLKPSSSNIWIWAYGPYANTVFYNDDVGDITVSAPWRGGANLDGGSTLGIEFDDDNGGEWKSTDFDGPKCAVCQSISTCDEVCDATGT